MPTSHEDGKKLKLTVFLIKANYVLIEDFLSVSSLSHVDMRLGGVEGNLFFKSGFRSTPPWVKIFNEVAGFDGSQIVNQSSRGIFVLRLLDRWFCFTFGYARHLIAEAAIERNFGLIVALNLGDPSTIKALDKTNVSHVGLQSREQAGRDIALEGFEFDTEVDLLKSITTKTPSADGEEQETYAGRDSVSVHTRVKVERFPDIAAKLLAAYQDTTYKARYPWIDKIREERDASLTSTLDNILLTRINQASDARIWLAVPQTVNWEDVDGFAYRERKTGIQIYPDIDLDQWMESTNVRGHVSLRDVKTRKIFICFKDGRPSDTWSVYRCLNAEVDHDQRKFILNDGAWYNVDDDYVRETNEFYSQLPISSLSLPPFGSRTEPTYLQFVGQTHPHLAVMDRKLVQIGGNRSSVEFCDLFSASGDIVHVKKYGGSSVLSHHFQQAVVSAECYLREPTFRSKLNEKLPEGFKLPNPDAVPDPKAHKICLAIMSQVPGPLEIPFFSKVSLKHAVKTIQWMGYQATVLKIERESQPA